MPMTNRIHRLRSTLLLSAALLCAAAPASAGAAFHLRLVSSDPAADATLSAPPATLRLTFSEAPELAVTTVRLRGPGDRAIALGRLQRAPRDRATLVATPRAALAHGRYTVTWRTMSQDGHPIHGTFAFTVGAADHGHSH